MKIRFLIFWVSPLLFIWPGLGSHLYSQCFKITFIYADACEAPDGKGEFLILETEEEVLPVKNLSIDLPGGLTICKTCANAWETPNVSNLNLLANCGTLFIGIGPADTIPANAMTIIFTNRNFKDDVNWANFCGTGPIYVLTINKVNNNNKYPHNDGSCLGTTYVTANFTGLSSCSSYTVSYEPCSLPLETPAGSGGGPALIFDDYGAVIYTDVGCDNFLVDAITLAVQISQAGIEPVPKYNYAFLDRDANLVIMRKSSEPELLNIQVVDLLGKSLINTQLKTTNGSASLDLSWIHAGLFFAVITDKFDNFTSHKFIRLVE